LEKEIQAEKSFAQGGPDLVGEALRDIGRSEWLRYWDELQIHSLRLTEARVRSLTSAGSLTQLIGLSFHGSADDGAMRAATESALPKLRTFGLQEVMFRDASLLTPDAGRMLLEATWLDQLQGLVLFGDWLDEHGLRALASSPRLSKLQSLEIRPHPSSWAGEGMRELLHSPHFSGLKLLNIAYTELDQAIATQLADPNILPGLEKLVVCYDDKKYGSLLRPRFGKELYFGSMEPEEGFDELDED
jgi:hypothetical protein